MITEFQDGFITKTKLNELVGGINTNSEELVDINGILANIMILTENTTKTVGSGGDFATLTEAISWCKKVIPNGHEVNLSLLIGFIWTENIVIEDCNFGFVRISSIDSVVYLNTTDNTGAITGRRSIMPVWDILLESTSGTRNGISLYGSDMRIKNNKGVIGCFQTLILFDNSYVNSDGIISAYSNIGTSFGEIGIYSSEIGCALKCNELNVVGGTYSGGGIYTNGIKVRAGGEIKSYTTIRRFSGTGNINLSLNMNSSAYVDYVDSSLSAKLYVDCINGSRCTINGQFGSSGVIGNIYSAYGSHVTLVAPTTVSGTLSVYKGGVIYAHMAGGTLSQTANTITANGIIFQ